MSKKLILLVENDKNIRNILKELIEMDGIYDVIALEDGLKAFTWLAENNPPDLVLTDFRMPGRGDFLAQAVSRVNVPVLVLTACVGMAANALKALNLKVPVMSKTTDVHKILNTIDVLTATTINKELA